MSGASAKRVVLGVTGASGAVYAVRLLDVLLGAGCEVQLAISPAGQAVIEQELGLWIELERFELSSLLPSESGWRQEARFAKLALLLEGATLASADVPRSNVQYYHYRNLLAPMASGSSLTDGMVVCPCSGGTLSAIATAASTNLIHRAAEVHLKERRKLVLVPRETPLSLIQIDNMRRVVEAGAVLLPAMPGYYHDVRRLSDLVDFVVARICDQLGVAHQLMRRWGET